MPEYIEREALMRRIKEIHCAECDSYHGVRCRACWVDDTLDYIDSEPAADIAQVRHGYWIERVHDDGYGEYVLFHCSECDTPNANKRNYCDHCGAKMDGGEPDA